MFPSEFCQDACIGNIALDRLRTVALLRRAKETLLQHLASFTSFCWTLPKDEVQASTLHTSGTKESALQPVVLKVKIDRPILNARAMLPNPTSPANGYKAESLDEAEDLESRSGQAETSQADPEEGGRESRLHHSSTKDSRFMHPDDSLLPRSGVGQCRCVRSRSPALGSFQGLHKHWYETTVRLRGMFVPKHRLVRTCVAYVVLLLRLRLCLG